MSLAEEAFKGLYPDKEFNYEAVIKYSGKFHGYNANVRYSPVSLQFKLSRNWKSVSREIQMGLLQSLMNKVFKTKIKTMNIDLYNIFLKKVHFTIPKTEEDPVLEESFKRVNEKYFNNILEIPNLKFGSDSFTKLGSYEYGSDTIIISNLFKDEILLLDYIMYHELLHKKYKFNEKDGRSYHHTKLFRTKEREFEEPDIEHKLKLFLARKKIKRFFRLPKII
jgi:hypothetical protein